MQMNNYVVKKIISSKLYRSELSIKHIIGKYSMTDLFKAPSKYPLLKPITELGTIISLHR